MRCYAPAGVEAFADLIDDLVRSALTAPGDADPALRRAAFDAAALAARGAAGPPTGLPDGIASLVDKVARHAYRVTDAEVGRLLEAGHSQDALFEVIVAASVGAGVARLELAEEALGVARGGADR